MPARRRTPLPGAGADDFQRAAAAAKAEADLSQRSWMKLTPREQTQAIYAQLRRIDQERAAALSSPPDPPSACGLAAKSTKRRG